MRRPYGRRHKSLQSAFPSTTRARIHISALTFSLSLAHSDTLLIASCVCQSKSIFLSFFSFAFYHLLLIPQLLKSSLSLLTHVMRAGLLKWIPSELNWITNVGRAASNPLEFYTTLCRNVRGSVVTQTTHFICMSKSRRRNWTFKLGHVKVALPLRAIQESQNKLVKHYRDDGVCRNKTTPWWTGLDCGGFFIVFITLSSRKSTYYVLEGKCTSPHRGQEYKSKLNYWQISIRSHVNTPYSTNFSTNIAGR